MGIPTFAPKFRSLSITLGIAVLFACRAASFTTGGDNAATNGPIEGANDTTIGNPGTSNATATPISTPASGTITTGNDTGTTTTTPGTEPTTTPGAGTVGTTTSFTTGTVAPVTIGTGSSSGTPNLQILANGQATSISIAPSHPVTISWTATGVTLCIVQPIAGSGLSGTMLVTPSATQVYTLLCQAGAGPVSATVTVLVVPQLPPTAQITANGASGSTVAAPGGSVALAWQSQNATQCTVSPGNFTGTSGSQTVALGNAPIVYLLTCQGPGGQAQSSVAINPATQSGLSATLTVNGTSIPLSVAYGSTVLVAWSSTGAQSCNVMPLNDTHLQNSVTTAPLTATVTYILTCTGANNTAVAVAVPVNVAPPLPPQVHLTVNGSTGSVVVPAGQTETIAWTQSQATACALTPNIAMIPLAAASGSAQTTAGATPVTFTLSCTGPGGTAASSVTVYPSVLPPTVTVTANGKTGIVPVPAGSAPTIVWTSTNASSCSTSPGNFTSLAGSVAYGPINAPAVFGVVCTGPYGTAVASVTVVPSTISNTVTQTLTVNGSTAPITIMTNMPVDVAWTSSGAVSCSVAPFNFAGTMGSQRSSPLTANTTVTLTCSDANGSKTVSSIAVTVTPATTGAYVKLTGNGSTGPLYITTANPMVQLVWVSTGTTSCMFNDGTVVATNGSKIVSVTSSTDYHITCTTTAGLTVTACLQIIVAASCSQASMVGINFEDEPLGHRDGDFNDFTACSTLGDFSLFDTLIVANREQIVPFTTSRRAVCSHNIRIEIHHPDGSSEPPIIFDDASGTPTFNLHFHQGSTLEVYMEPLDGCTNGETHPMHDPNWAIVKANECRRTGR